MSPVLGRHSLLALDGDRHLRQRKLMLPPFHGEAIGRYRERIEQITADEVATWPLGKPFAIRPRMQDITFEVILRAVIGVSDPRAPRAPARAAAQAARFQRLRHVVRVAVPEDARHPDGPPATNRCACDRRSTACSTRRSPPTAPTPRAATTSSPSSSRRAARTASRSPTRNLLDQIITLLLAGHETTTTGLAWAFERLVRHPAVLERLRSDLERGEEDYLDAVVNETLRVRPVIDGVWRKLTAPAVLAGHRLPAGTLVFPAISLVQTSAAFPDAEEFRPERFLDGSPPPYTFIPFGGGPRRCIGASFATMEMKTVLRTVLERVELHAADRRPEKPRVHHVTQIPSRGARVVAPRTKANCASRPRRARAVATKRAQIDRGHDRRQRACGDRRVRLSLVGHPGPSVADPGRVTLLNLAVFVAYLGVAFPVAWVWSIRRVRPIRAWMVGGRQPTPPSGTSLRAPLHQLQILAAGWGGAAVLFFAVNAAISVALAAEVSVAIVLGGVVTSALGYLLIERINRANTALALAIGPPRRPAGPGVTARLLLTWGIGTSVFLLAIAALAIAVLLDPSGESLERVGASVLSLSVGGLGVGLLTMRFAARSVADPLESIRSSARRGGARSHRGRGARRGRQ